LRADFFEPLQHFFGLGTVDAQIAGSDDRIGATLGVQISQTGIEPDQISVNVGDNGDAHSGLVALQCKCEQRRRKPHLFKIVEIDAFDHDARLTQACERITVARVGDHVMLA
jgi:hypothetical protein